MDKIIVGIDVSKDRLDVAVRPHGERFSVDRDPSGLEALVGRLNAMDLHLVVLEATGGLEGIVVAALIGARLPVAVADPAQVRAFAKAIGQRAKTDPIDAAVIAHFGAATAIEPRPLPDTATRQRADLVARRRQIVDMITAERPREKRANDRIKKSIARLVRALERELESVDADIDGAVKTSPAWREKENLIASVPGVGPVISRTLIAELPEFGSLDHKQIAALAGLAPFTRQSGQWRARSFIGGGRSRVRRALFMGGMVAIRHNAVLKAFHKRLIAARKARKIAIIVVVRKLHVMLNANVRDGCPWKETVQAAS
jgi:transposase